MKKLYARLVLALIRPALEALEAERPIWATPTDEDMERALKEWNEMLRSLQ